MSGDIVNQPQRTAEDKTDSQLDAAGIRRDERCQQNRRDGQQTVKVFVPVISRRDGNERERKRDNRAFEISAYMRVPTTIFDSAALTFPSMKWWTLKIRLDTANRKNNRLSFFCIAAIREIV